MHHNLKDVRLLLVGCGKMGGALIARWLKSGLQAQNILVIEYPEKCAEIREQFGVEAKSSVKPDGFAPDVIVFAIKPQSMGETLAAYSAFPKSALYISIAAGITLAFLERYLGPHKPIIRTMPNLPAIIGEGITAAVANRLVKDMHRRQCESLFLAVGKLLWVEEKEMDAVTAVSGSGPAYLFYFMECLLKGAHNLGLSEEQAFLLVHQTLQGSLSLVATANTPVEELRRQVTSPKGTTEAALSVLMQGNGLERLMDLALAAAAARSRELSE